jgi:hypothetical protein
MDLAVIDEIEKSQPFKSAKPDWHSFSLLNRLVNQDKHRTVRVVNYVNEMFRITEGTEASIVSIDDAPREMVDGAVVAEAAIQRPLSPPGAPPAEFSIPFNVELGYIENIELPTVGEQRAVLVVMEVIVNHVGETLGLLKTVGC